MAAGRSYIGASFELDPRNQKKEEKLLKSIVWPVEYSEIVDIKRVNIKLISY